MAIVCFFSRNRTCPARLFVVKKKNNPQGRFVTQESQGRTCHVLGIVCSRPVYSTETCFTFASFVSLAQGEACWKVPHLRRVKVVLVWKWENYGGAALAFAGSFLLVLSFYVMESFSWTFGVKPSNGFFNVFWGSELNTAKEPFHVLWVCLCSHCVRVPSFCSVLSMLFYLCTCNVCKSFPWSQLEFYLQANQGMGLDFIFLAPSRYTSCTLRKNQFTWPKLAQTSWTRLCRERTCLYLFCKDRSVRAQILFRDVG